MAERTVTDAEIINVLRGYPNEGSVRPSVHKWSTADFDYAFAQYRSYASSADWWSPWAELLRVLRDERHDREVREEAQNSENLRAAAAVAAANQRAIIAEEANKQRHDQAEALAGRRHGELLEKFEELKKPHWSVVPNFWIALVAAFAALAAAYFASLALKK